MQPNIPTHLKGLTTEEVLASQAQYGFNKIKPTDDTTWFHLLVDVMKEPMMLLLVAISAIYFFIGDYADAIFMFSALVIVGGISFYQDNRSHKALEEIEKLNEPLSTVIRNSKAVEIPTHEIAVGDLCIVTEGRIINADGEIIHSNDFSVNESSLTGESYSVFKDCHSEDNKVFSGTIAISGLAVFKVERIGAETRLGKIGTTLQDIEKEDSPLQKQITRFVKTMAVVGVVIFLMVCVYSFYETRDYVKSLLNGLTLAMSILPEEIPVAFTTFMALGAWKLMRDGIIIKRSSIVETLGSTTVVCADKTGTITKNSMELKHLYSYRSDKTFGREHYYHPELSELISYAMWSSEPVPFDPMESAIHEVYSQTQSNNLRKEYRMIHEYPLEGLPPMMTHLFEDSYGNRIIAAKGAPEAILNVCTLSENEKKKIREQIQFFSHQGYRLLGVAKSFFTGNDFPRKQQDFNFEFLGLTIFYDPPKEGINDVFAQLYEAGIKVKIITGDNAATTYAIAKQAGVLHAELTVNGDEISNYSNEALSDKVEKTVIFSRMFPEAKLAVVDALKKRGEIVAMLGDGVNDAPALKSAHIGVAMGHKGTEIAKSAAALVITNDDLAKLIVGIAAGRRIYTNIKKAIQYIISIHIPIILTVSLPLFLGWVLTPILTPIHVIFLELVMGPTCSIVYENEPMEKNTMQQPPRQLTETFLNWRELILSIIQGLAITAGVLFIYQYTVWQGNSEEHSRAMVFATLIFSNILLSFTNRSFFHSIFESFKNRNLLLTGVTIAVILLLAAILYIPPVTLFFKITSLNATELLVAFILSAASVLWFEVYKWIKRSRAIRL